MGARQFEARDGQSPADASGADDDLVSGEPKSSSCLDPAGVDKARCPGILMDRYAGGVDLRAQRRICSNVPDDRANTIKEPGIIQNRLADSDAVSTELPSIAQQPSSMGQGTDGYRAIVRCHAAKFGAGHQRGPRTQICSTKRRSNARGPGANNKHVSHLINSIRDKSSKRLSTSAADATLGCL
jgi:hypothetical protein